MVVLNIETSDCTPQTIVIGRRGTYDTTQIAFDLTYLVESYGSGVAVLAIKRSQDESAYPAVVTQEDATLLWTVSETDTAYVGSGECQIMWYVDGGLAKTIIYPMVVMRDILQTAEQPPDGYENWIEHLTELGAETQQNAQNAAQSASEAESAKDDAVTAKEAAGSAANRAETAAEQAESYASSAANSAGVASQKANDAALSANSASSSASSASSSAGSASASASSASESATAASNSASSASTSAQTATTKANEASSSASSAAGSAQTATTKAGEAAQSATAASEAQTAAETAQGKAEDAQEAAEAAQQAAEQAAQDVIDKAPVIINNASGDIASFPDGADSMPIKSLVASIEPVQDLHGYEYPWPAGGGANQWDEQWRRGYYTPTGEYSANDNCIANVNHIKVTPNTMYYFSLAARYSTEARIVFRDSSENMISVLTVSNATFTTPTDCVWIDFGTFAAVGITSYLNDISINYPATVTTYSPYSNICPISGHTGLTVARTGKNLFDSNILLEASGWTVSDGVYSGYNYELDRVFSVYQGGVPGLKFKESTRYTFAANFRSENAVLSVVGFAYTDGTKSESYWSDTAETRKTATSQANKTVKFMYLSYGSRSVIYLSGCQLEEGSTASTYEPYTGTTIPITFPSGAGTVYGATMTLNPDRTGTLKITDVRANTRDLEYAGFVSGTKSNCMRFVLSEIAIGASASTYRGAKSNMLAEYPAYFGSPRQNECDACVFAINTAGDRVALYDTDLSLTEETMRTKYADCMFVYPLATPHTIQLTAEQISGILTTLYGTNNIWSSTGDTEVEYPCDTKLYIDGKLAEIQATILENIGG